MLCLQRAGGSITHAEPSSLAFHAATMQVRGKRGAPIIPVDVVSRAIIKGTRHAVLALRPRSEDADMGVCLGNSPMWLAGMMWVGDTMYLACAEVSKQDAEGLRLRYFLSPSGGESWVQEAVTSVLKALPYEEKKILDPFRDAPIRAKDMAEALAVQVQEEEVDEEEGEGDESGDEEEQRPANKGADSDSSDSDSEEEEEEEEGDMGLAEEDEEEEEDEMEGSEEEDCEMCVDDDEDYL